MDSTIPEGAPKNPYHDYVQDYANIERNYQPTEYKRGGAYSWIEIPQQIKQKIFQSTNRIQNMVLPTLRQLRNERNISQIQDKLYRKLCVYQEQFNQCQISCRNVTQAYQCGDTFLSRLNNDMPKFVKKVIDEY